MAKKRKEEGECDLAVFLYSRSEKALCELILKAWTLENAQKILTEDSKSRMDRLEEAYNGDCVVDNCTWLASAEEVLALNKIDKMEYASAIMKALQFGRQKFRNVMLVGRSNTAKTFMLKPLQIIFGERLFENPAADKFGWSGVQNSQVIMLQDFRYSSDVIVWKDFLLLLEGETVKLPTPKNHHAEDIIISSTNDIPIFATSAHKIEFSRFSPHYERETEMMDSRWNIIRFHHVFSENEQRKIPACGRCFVDLITQR